MTPNIRGLDLETLGALYPSGVDNVCLDAMVLIHFQDTGNWGELEKLFPEGAYTTDVIFEEELGGNPGLKRKNKTILQASWLLKVPTLVGEDGALVTQLLSLWGSKPGKDRGEAEIVALCRRYKWVAVTDDQDKGRPELDKRELDYCYMATMLAFAAATGHAGHTAGSAYDLCVAVQANRAAPYLAKRKVFDLAVKAAETRWRKRGSPNWPAMLADSHVDAFIDTAERRKHPRRPRHD